MDRRLFTALARGLAILAVLPVAHAEVYQCVAPSGALLLTDRACPGGYQTRFVVDEPQREVPPAAPAETAPAPRRAAKGDGERLAAVEAEMDRLREQLELERMRGELMLEQLRLANR